MTESKHHTEWFDRFPPLNPDIAWNTQGQWCPRHWAPCPVLGANGIGATTELMQIFISEMAPKDVKDHEELNRIMSEMGYLCCTLGDDRMYELWGHWPPRRKDEDDKAV